MKSWRYEFEHLTPEELSATEEHIAQYGPPKPWYECLPQELGSQKEKPKKEALSGREGRMMREAGWVRCPGCGHRVAVPVCPAGGGIASIHECQAHVLSLHRRPTGEYVVVAYRNQHGFAVGPGVQLEFRTENPYREVKG